MPENVYICSYTKIFSATAVAMQVIHSKKLIIINGSFFFYIGQTWELRGCMVACVLSRFSHVWLFSPMGCSLQGSSVHGLLQARILEWVAMHSFRGSSWSRDWTPSPASGSLPQCHLGSLFLSIKALNSKVRESNAKTSTSCPLCPFQFYIWNWGSNHRMCSETYWVQSA